MNELLQLLLLLEDPIEIQQVHEVLVLRYIKEQIEV